MQLTLLARNSLSTQYLVHRLQSAGIEVQLVLEEGKLARRRKIRRDLQRSPKIAWPLVLLNIAGVALYSSVCQSLVRARFEADELADISNADSVSDINAEELRQFLAAADTDATLVCGTSIILADTLVSLKAPVLNLHGGMVPYYRNVHADFWAYVNSDFEHMGCSILHLDEGIDSGSVARQSPFVFARPEASIIDVKEALIRQGSDMLIDTLATPIAELPSVPQSGQGGFYRTPTLGNLLRYSLKLFSTQKVT